METIRGFDYQGRECHLVFKRTGAPIQKGEVLEDFRGDIARILSGTPPHKPSSTGKVSTSAGEYYPGVFNCEWKRR